MLQSSHELLQCRVQAEDGPAGSLHDLCFDDRDMKAIFAVVITGPWPRGPRVIVPSESLGTVDTKLKEISVTLTTEQVKSAHRWDVSNAVHMRSVRELS